MSDPEFDLNHVRGRLVISEEVKIPASETTVVKALTMITGHHKHIHVLVESSHKCMNVFILGNTSELRPGNIIPTMQVSNDFDVVGKERASSMSAQVKSTNILEKLLM